MFRKYIDIARLGQNRTQRLEQLRHAFEFVFRSGMDWKQTRIFGRKFFTALTIKRTLQVITQPLSLLLQAQTHQLGELCARQAFSGIRREFGIARALALSCCNLLSLKNRP